MQIGSTLLFMSFTQVDREGNVFYVCKVRTADGQSKFKKRSSWHDGSDGSVEHLPLQNEMGEELSPAVGEMCD